MRSVMGCALVALGGSVWASESCPVLAVPGPDHVVVKYQGLPVEVALAYIDAPHDPAARSSCQKRLSDLVAGKRVSLTYLPGFGVDTDGAARVSLQLEDQNINLVLVGGGFARFLPGARPESAYDDPVRKAESRAKAEHLGIWAPAAGPADSSVASNDAPPAAPVAAPADATPPADAAVPPPSSPQAPARAPSGPFCSELDSKYYYPSGSPAVANVNPQRLIYYPDEASAGRAGKLPSPQLLENSLPTDVSEGTADAIFGKGRDIYASAIAAGNTPERDHLYEQAFVVLTKAMQVYSKLCEARPDDDALGEKLRVCMQLRYGSVKQRRFE